jgi:hypothetical protein
MKGLYRDQPKELKSLVTYDIRGAQTKAIAHEVKDHPSEYFVSHAVPDLGSDMEPSQETKFLRMRNPMYLDFDYAKPCQITHFLPKSRMRTQGTDPNLGRDEKTLSVFQNASHLAGALPPPNYAYNPEVIPLVTNKQAPPSTLREPVRIPSSEKPEKRGGKEQDSLVAFQEEYNKRANLPPETERPDSHVQTETLVVNS